MKQAHCKAATEAATATVTKRDQQRDYVDQLKARADADRAEFDAAWRTLAAVRVAMYWIIRYFAAHAAWFRCQYCFRFLDFGFSMFLILAS